MTDTQTTIDRFDAMRASIMAALEANHPANVAPAYTSASVAGSETDVQAAEAGVTAAENEPGLGDGTADPVAQAERSSGLYATPSARPAQPPAPGPSAAPAAPPPSAQQLAMRQAFDAVMASQSATTVLIGKAFAAADAAITVALAASAPQRGVGGWGD